MHASISATEVQADMELDDFSPRLSGALHEGWETGILGSMHAWISVAKIQAGMKWQGSFSFSPQRQEEVI